MAMKRSVRSRHGPKSADDVDRHVGHRIRAQRMSLGMSQSDVADRLDLTFQQIQKYERGVNRIGVGRLNQIADILGVPVTYFLRRRAGNRDGWTKTQGPRRRVRGEPHRRLPGDQASLLLTTTFLQIKDENIRRRVLGLMIALSGSGAGKVLRSRVGPGLGRNSLGAFEE